MTLGIPEWWLGPGGRGGSGGVAGDGIGWGGGLQDGCKDAGDWKSGKASGVNE